VSGTAAAIAAVIGLPAGAVPDLVPFRGRSAVVGVLFTPTAMIVAQVVLATPLVAALARQAVADAWRELEEQLRSLGAGPWRAALTLAWDARGSLSTSVLAGLGRAIAEVGAVLIVGGNLDHVTRTLTTAIALAWVAAAPTSP
jgi:tungstate transport system permease protein